MELEDILLGQATDKAPARWWIVAPAGHRAHWNTLEAEVPEWMAALGPVTIISSPHTEEWICDYCNAHIELVATDPETGEQVETFVPVSHGNALCHRCVIAEAHEQGMISPTTNRLLPSTWSLALCGCPPCSERMRALYEHKIAEQGQPDADG